MRFFKSFLKDEIDWFNSETTFFEKILPFLSQKNFIRFVVFITTLLLISIFPEVFITVIFILVASYIKFKRLKHGIPIELEPSFLFAIVLTISFGVNYGLFYIIVREIVTSVAKLTIIVFLNILVKIALILGTYLIWYYFQFNIVIISFAIVMVLTFLSFKLRLKLGQPNYEVLMVIISDFFLRWAYFSIFLEFLIGILSAI